MFKKFLLRLHLFIGLLCHWANGQLAARDCLCVQKYTLTTDTPIDDLDVELAPVRGNDDRDTCDFRCARTCNENVRELIGGDRQSVTLEGREKMCDDVAPDRSVIKDGIVLWNYWKLNLCYQNQVNRVNLDDNICCIYCKCKLIYYRGDELIPPLDGGAGETLKIEWDLSDAAFEPLNEGRRAFKCNTIEHDRVCETSCRREIAALTEYELIHEHLDESRFDVLKNREHANRICEKLFPDEQINSPGIDLMMRMETGPLDSSLHKNVHLGKLCCRRRCTCEVIYKNTNLLVNQTEMTIDLTPNLPERDTSYYCDQEARECVDDCKIAAGVLLRNEPIQSQHISALDIDIFAKFDTARRTCIVYRRDTKKNEGVYIYLRYSTGTSYMKQIFPYTQTMFLGHVCCETYQGIQLFPFNKCKMWNYNDIPDVMEPIPPLP